VPGTGSFQSSWRAYFDAVRQHTPVRYEISLIQKFRMP